MLVTKIIFWAFATATATALLTVKDVATKFGISETDIKEILSASDVSSINVDKWADFLDVSLKDIKSWPQSDKVAALKDVKKNLKTYMESDARVEKRQDNRQKLQQEIDAKIAQYRYEHEADHRRRLAGCPSVRCGVCGAGLTVAYVAALTACGAAAATAEAISAGTLTPAAVVSLGACVSAAHATYVGGWTFCLGMKD
jgi:Skp family chaperone for outer membrane proteins